MQPLWEHFAPEITREIYLRAKPEEWRREAGVAVTSI
jgi:hypothetical protein